jgi:hypothetical protein
VIRELHQMQRDRRTQPVSAPAPHDRHSTRVTVG